MTKTFDKNSIIPIEGGYVVVDKEAKKNYGDYILMEGEIIGQFADGNPAFVEEDFKIIASIGKRIEGVPLIEETDDVYFAKLAEIEYRKIPQYCKYDELRFIDLFKAGYKAAQSKGQYSEEDMKFILDAFELNFSGAKTKEDYKERVAKFSKWFNSGFINKSLQTKRPISVELEMEKYKSSEGELTDFYSLRLKITNPKENTIIPVKITYNGEEGYKEFLS